jgi:hypothetical protein
VTYWDEGVSYGLTQTNVHSTFGCVSGMAMINHFTVASRNTQAMSQLFDVPSHELRPAKPLSRGFLTKWRDACQPLDRDEARRD